MKKVFADMQELLDAARNEVKNCVEAVKAAETLDELMTVFTRSKTANHRVDKSTNSFFI